MNRLLTFAMAFAVGAASLCLVACESESGTVRRSSDPATAVEAPVSQNDAMGEMASQTVAGTTIVSVDGPNSKNDHPIVHTILDPLLNGGKPPTAIINPPAATRPTPTIIVPRRSDPISGPSE